MTMIVSALLSLLFASQTVANANEAAPHPKHAAVQQENGTTRAPEKPANVQEITYLLSARHPEDMPDDGVWEARPDAAEALRWIVIHGPLNLHRARALSILRHYPESSTKDLLLNHLEEVRYHTLIRSAAAHGLMGQTLEESECTRIGRLDASDSEGLKMALRNLLADRCTK